MLADLVARRPDDHMLPGMSPVSTSHAVAGAWLAGVPDGHGARMTSETSEPGRSSESAKPSPAGATMSEVIAGYADAGFTADFDVTDEGRLQCGACDALSAPADVRMSSLRRLEGESDPADMVAVVALTCPACGAEGTVVLGYGPMAAGHEADVLHALRDERSADGLPGNSAPGEAVGDSTAASRSDGRGGQR